jgi:hypothetical protein
MSNINSVLISYSLLIKDFQNLLEFIHPVDDNLQTYSHRTYELFLRTSTEFENVCKDKLKRDGHPKRPEGMSIGDYKTLNTKLKLDEAEIGLLFWDSSPNQKYIQPFGDWATGQPLGWYSSYNQVKHNRSTDFKEANFQNLISALSGLSLVNFKVFGHDFFTFYQHPRTVSSRGTPGYTETFFSNSIFSFKTKSLP